MRGSASHAASAAPAFRRVAIPPLALGGALLLWGWQIQSLALAVPMAVVLEAARWVPWRWDLSDTDFNRIADATTLGFLALAVYQFDAHSIRGIYFILRWFPAVLFLLVAAQVYSTRDRVEYTALFLSVRRAVVRGVVRNPGAVDFTNPYLAVCLLSACAGTLRGPYLFAGLGAVLAVVLWHNRPRRYRTATWVVFLLASLALGYLNHVGVLALRRVVEPLVMAYFHERVWNYRDPYRTFTAMGHIGRLKQSERILLRVRPDGAGRVPGLLRDASYQTFSKNLWLAGRTEFATLTPDDEGTTWDIGPRPPRSRNVGITAHLPRGKGLLAVPTGTHRVSDLPVEDVYRSRLGALKVLRGPELVEYDAHYDPATSVEAPPDASDLSVPVDLTGLFARLNAELGLAQLPVRARVAAVERYFEQGFRYSLDLRRSGSRPTPIHTFLEETRAGHCEFFATATALLLRAAGVPTRYATGYAVFEWSPLEERYLVRRRHAHSWVLGYVDGRWRDIDTTPGAWGETEAAEAPWWQGVYDLASWLRYRYARWRWGPSSEEDGVSMLWIAGVLMLVLVWRLYASERVSRSRGAAPAGGGSRTAAPGADSELYRIERHLSDGGFARAPDEPWRDWLARLEHVRAPGLEDLDQIRDDLLPLHYRYRFDPLGVSAAERERLRSGVQNWLERHPQPRTARPPAGLAPGPGAPPVAAPAGHRLRDP